MLALFPLTRRLEGLSTIERLALSIPLGFSLSTLVAFLLFLAFSSVSFAAFFSLALLFLAALFGFAGGGLDFWKREAHKLAAELRENKLLTALLLLSLLGSAYFFSTHVLEQGEAGLYSSGSTWGDLPYHLTLINSFLHGSNSAPQGFYLANPVLAGTRLVYPFIPDFHSVILSFLGAGLRDSILFPSVMLSVSLVALLYFFSFRMASNKLAAFLAVLLVLFSGGLGFLQLPLDLNSSGKGAYDFLSSLPADYVHSTPSDGNFYWLNFVTDVFLPQRSSLFAFPLGLSVFILILESLRQEGRQRRMLLGAAGLGAGLLLSTQPLSFIAVGIAVFSLAVFDIRGKLRAWFFDWLFFAVPAGVLGLPQLLLLAGYVSQWGLARLSLLWNAEPAGPAVFWLKNLGVFFALGAAAMFLLSPAQRRLYVGFAVVFLAANVLLFQPWNVDSTKLLYYWFFATAPFVGLLLSKVWGLKPALFSRALFALALAALVASGALAIAHETQQHYLLYSNEDLRAGKWIAENTASNAVFLSSDYHAHPASSLAGRQLVMGYRGWVWSHGYEYSRQEKEVFKMFEGGSEALKLLKEYRVNYVVVGPPSFQGFNANEKFFQEKFAKVFESSNYKVYLVSRQA